MKNQTSPKKVRGYIEHYNPHRKTVELLKQAIAVLNEYRDYWALTVRQIFYRLVGAHGYPKTEADYKKLCHDLANARRARWIPFEAIRDDGVTTILDAFKRHIRVASVFVRSRVRLMAC